MVGPMQTAETASQYHLMDVGGNSSRPRHTPRLTPSFLSLAEQVKLYELLVHSTGDLRLLVTAVHNVPGVYRIGHNNCYCTEIAEGDAEGDGLGSGGSRQTVAMAKHGDTLFTLDRATTNKAYAQLRQSSLHQTILDRLVLSANVADLTELELESIHRTYDPLAHLAALASEPSANGSSDSTRHDRIVATVSKFTEVADVAGVDGENGDSGDDDGDDDGDISMDASDTDSKVRHRRHHHAQSLVGRAANWIKYMYATEGLGAQEPTIITMWNAVDRANASLKLASSTSSKPAMAAAAVAVAVAVRPAQWHSHMSDIVAKQHQPPPRRTPPPPPPPSPATKSPYQTTRSRARADDNDDGGVRLRTRETCEAAFRRHMAEVSTVRGLSVSKDAVWAPSASAAGKGVTSSVFLVCAVDLPTMTTTSATATATATTTRPIDGEVKSTECPFIVKVAEIDQDSMDRSIGAIFAEVGRIRRMQSLPATAPFVMHLYDAWTCGAHTFMLLERLIETASDVIRRNSRLELGASSRSGGSGVFGRSGGASGGGAPGGGGGVAGDSDRKRVAFLDAGDLYKMRYAARNLNLAGLVHGDLHGANIMRAQTGAWKVIDLGNAFTMSSAMSYADFRAGIMYFSLYKAGEPSLFLHQAIPYRREYDSISATDSDLPNEPRVRIEAASYWRALAWSDRHSLIPFQPSPPPQPTTSTLATMPHSTSQSTSASASASTSASAPTSSGSDLDLYLDRLLDTVPAYHIPGNAPSPSVGRHTGITDLGGGFISVAATRVLFAYRYELNVAQLGMALMARQASVRGGASNVDHIQSIGPYAFPEVHRNTWAALDALNSSPGAAAARQED